MSDDQFTRLFKYMEKKFGEIDKRFEKMSKDIADVRASVGELSVRADGYHTKVLALTGIAPAAIPQSIAKRERLTHWQPSSGQHVL